MGTITGNLKFITDSAARQTVKFVPTQTPLVSGSSVIIKTELSVITDASGDLPSTTLIAGKYTVELSNGESFDIDVPAGSGTHALPDIIDSSGSTSDTSLYVRRVFCSTFGASLTSTIEASIIGSGQGSLALAANFFTAGKTLRGAHRGYFTTTASPGTFTPRLKNNGTTILSIAGAPFSSAGTQALELRWSLTCRSVGASGNVRTEMSWDVLHTSDGTIKRFSTTADVTFDTTAAATLTMTGQWSASSQTVDITTALVEAAP